MEKIKFDSRDWNSIRQMVDAVNDADSMLFGETEDDESIIFSVEADDDEDYTILHTIVNQNNGFIRHNYYHPDYTVEEVFDGKWK